MNRPVGYGVIRAVRTGSRIGVTKFRKALLRPNITVLWDALEDIPRHHLLMIERQENRSRLETGRKLKRPASVESTERKRIGAAGLLAVAGPTVCRSGSS